MFWGLVIEPGKKYTQTVENSFHISKAALELSGSNADEDTTLMLDFEGQQEYILCHLNKKTNKQESLDLNFQSGDSISIFTQGAAAVHLSGYLLGDDDDEDMTLGDMLEEEEEEEEDADESMEMETNLKGNKRTLPGNGLANSKKKKKLDAEQEESDEDEEEGEEEEDEDEEEEEKPKPPAKPVQQAKPKEEKNKPKPLQPQQQQQQKQKQANDAKGGKPNKDKEDAPGSKPESAKKTLPGGLVVEDLKAGGGSEAVSGKKVGVYYVGRLQQGKVFDQCNKGQPFKFRLGAGEVIKGWDAGVAGMKIGGKRRLTIPAHLAYGKRGSPPDIPPNSTLVFDVELKSVQ